MGHSVQLVVGRDNAIGHFLARWPGTRAVDLQGGWRAIPVDDALRQAIADRFPDAILPEALDYAPPGIALALTEATKLSGGLAYVETDYFGGTGEQSAMACMDGREVFAPARSRGAGGPINGALRAIGATRSEADDEFDMIGLGFRRSMSDYEPEGSVRLRRETVKTDARGNQTPAFPVWVVLLVVAASVGLGFAVAIMR